MTTHLATPTNFLKKQLPPVLLCAGVIGTTALAMAPAAEAKNHHHHRHNRHELRQLRRDIRHDTRAYRHARRAYHRDVNRYPRLMPAYGPGYVYGTPAGFGIQLRF